MNTDHSDNCNPKDIALKTFFLGPQAENSNWLRRHWLKIIDQWLAWRMQRFTDDGRSISQADQQSGPFLESLDRLDKALDTVICELEQETTKFTPRYIGHMVSEVSLPALLGHVCAVLHNPNNTSREVSRVTSRFEREAISDLAKMLGFSNQAQGHFTSGGTLANFEALWRARCSLDCHLSLQLSKMDGQSKGDLDQYSLIHLGPWPFAKDYHRITGKLFLGPVVLVPESRHYSWEKAISLMGLGENAFVPVALDKEGRLDVKDLKAKIEWAISECRPIAMIVSIAGTTEMGSVDPIGQVQDLLETYRHQGHHMWHHVDGAYGAYYACMLDGEELESHLRPEVATAIKMIGKVDSVTLDPHKLGYVPYACGAFIARDEEHYRTRQFRAAYLLRDNKSSWSSTIEGSRSGAGVTATWLANYTLGLGPDGYGRLLARGVRAREKMQAVLENEIDGISFLGRSDLNILTFCIVPEKAKLSEVNQLTAGIFEKFKQSPNFSISKTVLSLSSYERMIHDFVSEKSIELDDNQLFLLRLVLMNPFLDTKESQVNYIQEFAKELNASFTL